MRNFPLLSVLVITAWLSPQARGQEGPLGVIEKVTLKGTSASGAEAIIIGQIAGAGHPCVNRNIDVVSYERRKGGDGSASAEDTHSIQHLGVTQTSTAKVDLRARRLESSSQAANRWCEGRLGAGGDGESLAFFYATYRIASDTLQMGTPANIILRATLDGALSSVGTPETSGEGAVLFLLKAAQPPLPASPDWAGAGLLLLAEEGDSAGLLPGISQSRVSLCSVKRSNFIFGSEKRPWSVRSVLRRRTLTSASLASRILAWFMSPSSSVISLRKSFGSKDATVVKRKRNRVAVLLAVTQGLRPLDGDGPRSYREGGAGRSAL